MAKLLKTAPLNDGTEGKRFAWGLYRKRQHKKRYGIVSGPSMLAIHTGKRSLYIERRAGRPLCRFAG